MRYNVDNSSILPTNLKPANALVATSCPNCGDLSSVVVNHVQVKVLDRWSVHVVVKYDTPSTDAGSGQDR